MITISILGLDQYVVGHYSGENTAKLAKLFETSPDNIVFYAPESFLFHDGVEQTSWNTLIRVSAPSKYRKLQDLVAKYLLGTMEGVTIHCAVEFTYYQESDRYEKINKEYPRFITDANMVAVEDEEEEPVDPDELYEGNIFADFEKAQKAAEKEKPENPAKKCEEGCDCDHDSDEPCCDDESCECHHDHHGKHSAK